MNHDLLDDEPVVDFLAEQPPAVIDFLSDSAPAAGGDVFCDPLQGGCGHFLTAHSRGMIVFDRCLMLDCKCQKAVITRNKRG
jgi:hypothetical protein